MALVTAGQALFSFAATAKTFYLALIGRIIFGYFNPPVTSKNRLGGESLTVIASSLEAFWFKGTEIALAMSIDTSLSNVGTVLNDYLQPRFYNISGGLSFGMWVGFITCVFSLFAGCGAFCVDRRREVTDKSLRSVCFFPDLDQ